MPVENGLGKEAFAPLIRREQVEFPLAAPNLSEAVLWCQAETSRNLKVA